MVQAPPNPISQMSTALNKTETELVKYQPSHNFIGNFNEMSKTLTR